VLFVSHSCLLIAFYLGLFLAANNFSTAVLVLCHATCRSLFTFGHHSLTRTLTLALTRTLTRCRVRTSHFAFKLQGTTDFAYRPRHCECANIFTHSQKAQHERHNSLSPSLS